MKKINKKLAGAMLPLLFLGNPAFASSRNVSSRKSKKSFAFSSSKQAVKTTKNKLQKNPFEVFGKSSQNVKVTKIHEDVLSFLNEEGLLQNSKEQKSTESGESGERKDFAGLCGSAVSTIVCLDGAKYKPWGGATYYLYTIANKNGSVCANAKNDSGYNFNEVTMPFVWNSAIRNACRPGDSTAPTFDNSTPSQNSIDHQQVVINVDINEGGKAYAVVVANGAAAPTSANVKAGQANGGGVAVSTGNVTLNSGAFSGTITLTGLSASTAYDVYVVAEDDEGTPNLQASAIKVDITTSAAPNTAPTVDLDADDSTTGNSSGGASRIHISIKSTLTTINKSSNNVSINHFFKMCA